MKVFLAGNWPGSRKKAMQLYLAGTERIPNDVRAVNKSGGKNMELYLAEADGVAAGYLKKLKEESERTMNVLLAGGEPQLKSAKEEQGISEKDLYKGAYILQSFFYASDFTENVIIPNCKDFLLDSGAFTFMTSAKGKNIDWNDYIQRYADFINKNHIKKYFELDIDSIVGLDKVLEIRKKLENLTGVKPIPVWHKSRGLEQFKKDASEYPYVAIGGIVSQEITRKEYPAFSMLIAEAHRRGAKIHGLGFTNLEGIKKYHFDSVDSTAWVSGNRFGAVYYFDGKTMKKIGKKPGQRVKTNQVAINNFNEWKKFSNYAERNL